MKHQLKKGLVYLLMGFLILFVLRLIYGYMAYPVGSVDTESQISRIDWDAYLTRRNYASKKLKRETPGKTAPLAVDQKYEKVGTLSSKTSEFEADEKKVRTVIQEHNILIQFEQHSGLKGKRTLNLALGVIPEKFDQVISEARRIGTLVFIQIDKRDKTNEYKELKAKRMSLEKTREALSRLKSQGGSVEEFIKLEDRILQIENDIQAMGVRLGEFDEENEFCTVKFTLVEVRPTLPIPFSRRLKVAFEWTVKLYLRLVVTCFIGTLLILIVLSVIQKGRWLQRTIEQIINETGGFLKKDK